MSSCINNCSAFNVPKRITSPAVCCRPFVKRFAMRYPNVVLSVSCLSGWLAGCKPVRLIYCGQTVSYLSWPFSEMFADCHFLMFYLQLIFRRFILTIIIFIINYEIRQPAPGWGKVQLKFCFQNATKVLSMTLTGPNR